MKNRRFSVLFLALMSNGSPNTNISFTDVDENLVVSEMSLETLKAVNVAVRYDKSKRGNCKYYTIDVYHDTEGWNVSLISNDIIKIVDRTTVLVRPGHVSKGNCGRTVSYIVSPEFRVLKTIYSK